jgi:antitoxin FitA
LPVDLITRGLEILRPAGKNAALQDDTEVIPRFVRESWIAIIAINAIIDGMASITIRKLPENTKRRLRMRAARNGHSMEQEARELLELALRQADPQPKNLGEAIHRRFAALGGVELKIPPRGPLRDPGIR